MVAWTQRPSGKMATPILQKVKIGVDNSPIYDITHTESEVDKMKIVYAENLPSLPIIGDIIRIGPDVGEVIEVGYCGGTGKNWVKIEVE